MISSFPAMTTHFCPQLHSAVWRPVQYQLVERKATMTFLFF